ncbi:hypothetical protein WSM22_23200 [Cytophagales bacterium WSM2-2]|nr:hypothetical protein WSM22_23200 [Cytophagales bacterium WSM2-2]
MYGIINYNVEILSKFSDLLRIEKIEDGVRDDSTKKQEGNPKVKKSPAQRKNGNRKSVQKSELLDLTRNYETPNKIYSIFKENGIIPDISEIFTLR